MRAVSLTRLQRLSPVISLRIRNSCQSAFVAMNFGGRFARFRGIPWKAMDNWRLLCHEFGLAFCRPGAILYREAERCREKLFLALYSAGQASPVLLRSAACRKLHATRHALNRAVARCRCSTSRPTTTPSNASCSRPWRNTHPIRLLAYCLMLRPLLLRPSKSSINRFPP